MASVLFVHQSFPAQFEHLAKSLAACGHYDVHSMGLIHKSHPVAGVCHHPYQMLCAPSSTLPLASAQELSIIMAASALRCASHLKKNGLEVDLIIAHASWGEATFLKQVWPKCKILLYLEYYHTLHGGELGNVPDFMSDSAAELQAHAKNANLLLNLQNADHCLTPTPFQKRLIPAEYHCKTTVIHDGIRSEAAKPLDVENKRSLLEIRNLKLSLDGKKLITYVSRTLEPMRGFHTLMRCLPYLMSQEIAAHVVIVGSKLGHGYSGRRSDGRTWLEAMTDEIDLYDSPWKDRVSIVGEIPYSDYLLLLQHSDCHVYLTYPFVASWSLLEAMSVACPIVASNTPPVSDFITDGYNGRLVDLYDHQDLANTIIETITNVDDSTSMGRAARHIIDRNYSLRTCLPKQLDLIAQMLSGCNNHCNAC